MWNFPALALQEDSAHLKALSAQRDQIDEHLKRTQKVLESWKGQIGPQTCTQSCRSNASASSRPQANHPKSSTAQVIEAERVVNKLQYKVSGLSAAKARIDNLMHASQSSQAAAGGSTDCMGNKRVFGNPIGKLGELHVSSRGVDGQHARRYSDPARRELHAGVSSQHQQPGRGASQGWITSAFEEVMAPPPEGLAFSNAWVGKAVVAEKAGTRLAMSQVSSLLPSGRSTNANQFELDAEEERDCVRHRAQALCMHIDAMLREAWRRLQHGRGGMKWQNVGIRRPSSGREVHNAVLAQALSRNKTEFTRQERAEFGAFFEFERGAWSAVLNDELNADHFINTVDGFHYSPVDADLAGARARRAVVTAEFAPVASHMSLSGGQDSDMVMQGERAVMSEIEKALLISHLERKQDEIERMDALIASLDKKESWEKADALMQSAARALEEKDFASARKAREEAEVEFRDAKSDMRTNLSCDFRDYERLLEFDDLLKETEATAARAMAEAVDANEK